MPKQPTAAGRGRRLLAGLAALAALAGMIGGLPPLLTYSQGVLLPSGWTPLADLPSALAAPDDGSLLVQAVLAAGWITWVSFCVLVVWEVIRRLFGRPATGSRLPTPRGLAGLLVAAAAALAAPAANAAQTGSAAVVATEDLHSDQDQPSPPARHTASSEPALHLVQRGEALLDLQERYGVPWQRIAEANYDREQPDGQSLQRGRTVIHAGWQLRIPPPATGPAAAAGGDSTPAAGKQPATAPTTGYTEPHTGQTTAAADPRPGPQQLRYEVTRGDWMWHIADRYLGDPHRYPDIAVLNPHLDARYQDYPDHIQPGDTLLLPTDAHDRGPRQHATGQATPIDHPPAPPGQRPEPAPPADPAPDTPAPPANTPPAPANTPPAPADTSSPPAADTPPPAVPGHVPGGDDGVVTPPSATSPPPATGSPSGHPQDSPTADEHPPPNAEEPGANQAPDGVDLPAGGWVALPVAAAIAAAAALAMINRRRRWRPGDDASTQQLPKLVGHIRRPAPDPAAEQPPPGPGDQPVADHPPDDRDGLDQLEHAAATVTPATIGADPQRPRQLDTLPPAGVALAGPGAAAATRGLLTAALAAGGPHRPDQAAEAITTADLLADLELTDPGLPRLHVATSTHHALNTLQIEINRRYHVLSDDLDHPTDDLPDPPLLVLLAGGIGPQHLHRLDALVNLGHHVGVRTVLLGVWPDRPTWQVGTDGHATGAESGLRLNTLPPDEAGQILATLAEAHTEPDTHAAPPADQPAATPAPAAAPAPQPPAATGRPGEPDRLLLRLLGKPTAQVPGRQKIRIQRAAAVHLATYLAVHPHGASLGASKDEMLEQVLGDKTMRSASQTFDSAIHQLRRALTDPGTGRSAIAKHRNGHYHLDPTVIDVDWWQLQHAADAGHPQQVLDLYQGPLGHGIDQDWLTTPRQHARNLALAACDQLADAADHPDQALAHVEAALHLDPYNEHFHRRAMRIHADRGDHTAVRRVLRRLTDRLAALDAEPTQETRDLAAQLITSQQPPDTASEPPPADNPPTSTTPPTRGQINPDNEPQPVPGPQPQPAAQ